jgi:phage/plasmid primase-like uncharacterized protein
MSIASHLVERARDTDIVSVVRQYGLQLRRVGRELTGPCVVCGGSDRFAIDPRRGLWNCRQCARGGDVITLQQHIDGSSFADAVRVLAGAVAAKPAQDRRRTGANLRTESTKADDDVAALARADAIWGAAMPIAGTDGEAYLASRGIALEETPDRAGLRFHPACPYGRLGTTPAIVARFTDIITNTARGIHRRAVLAGTEPKTMSLGPVGGAVVRLWPDDAVEQGLIIGEGVETVLAAATRIEHRGTLLQPAWACGSAGTLEAFPVLPGVYALTILADADGSGRGQDAAERCAERWANAGREVTILTPRDLGFDFNDVVRP